MKKSMLISVALSFALAFTSAFIGTSEAQASTYIHSHTYSKGIKYPQVTHLKSKSAQKRINKTLKNYAKKVNTNRKKFLKKYPNQKGSPKSSETLTYTVKYFKNGKLSIAFFDNQYNSGAMHGLTDIKEFNFYTKKGSNVSLRSNFKSSKAYKRANKYAQSYMKKHPNRYPFAFEFGQTTNIYGHEYYWTKSGLSVQFQVYEVASYADGPQTVFIPSKYFK